MSCTILRLPKCLTLGKILNLRKIEVLMNFMFLGAKVRLHKMSLTLGVLELELECESQFRKRVTRTLFDL